MKLATALFVVMWIVLAVAIDVRFLPAAKEAMLAMRAVSGLLFLVPAAFIQLAPPRAFERGWQAALVAAALVILPYAPVNAAVLNAWFGEHLRPVWSGGHVMVLASVLLGVAAAHTLARFFHATAIGLFCTLAHGLVVAWIAGLGPDLVADLFWLGVANALGMIGSYHTEKHRRIAWSRARLLDAERARSEGLLHNILPSAVADRLKAGERPLADSVAEVTVLFADIVGFTALSQRLTPQALVQTLDELFSAFDDLAERHGLEKIKTIGDAYMVVGGVPLARTDHVSAVADMALAMRGLMAARGLGLKLRIGIHTGPVVAGVIGKKKFSYDLWGDTVNTASRMESHGLEDEIHASDAVEARLRDDYLFEPRGRIAVKGKGEMSTWLLRGRKRRGERVV